MILRAAVVVVLCVPALTFAQSLGEIARKTEESRKASTTPAVKLDQRDVDARVHDPELIEFRFDNARWERLLAADVWTTQAVDRNPDLYERVSGARVQSIRSLERVLAREPDFQAALKSAGSNPHEFAYANGAMLLSMLFLDKDLTPDVLAQLPPAVKDNIDFMRAHLADVRSMAARSLQLKERMEKQQKR
jgi:hypothetical protein